MASVATVVEYGKISQFLAAQDIVKGSIFRGGKLDKNLPLTLNIVWSSLEHTNDVDPTNEYLTATKNYLYALCGKYALQAMTIIGDNGGQVIEPPGGTGIVVVAIYIQFVVGQPLANMTAGETVLTITYDDILLNSISVMKDTIPLPTGLTNQQSFTVVYNPSNAVITFNEPVADGQLFQIRGLRYINQ